MLAGHSIRVTHQVLKKQLATGVVSQAVCAVSIPISDLPCERQGLTATLCDPSGKALAEQNLDLTKRAPKPGREWKVDRINRVLLNNGKPFFLIGMAMLDVTPDQEWAFKDVAQAGFNTVLQWSQRRDPDTDPQAYLQVAAKYGLLVITWPDQAYTVYHPLGDPLGVLKEGELKALNKVLANSGGISLTSMKGVTIAHPALSKLPRAARSSFFAQYFESNLPRILTGVRNSRDYSNLLGYNVFDEPYPSHFDQHVQGRILYDKIQEADGYHPVFSVWQSNIPMGKDHLAWTDWCDVLGTDPYWCPAGQGVRGNINHLSRQVAISDRRAEEQRVVTYVTPKTEYWSGVRKRSMTPAEQQCQTYLALIHGVRAICFNDYQVETQSMFDRLGAITRELKVLGPIILMPDLDQNVTYSPGRLDPLRNVFTDVQVRLMRHPKGGTVLLAANSAAYPVDTTFSADTLGPTGTVRRLFAEDTYAMRDGTFSDRIEGFGTRAYLLPGNWASNGPARIAVAMTPRKELAIEEPRGQAYRIGRRNVMPNPSFEEDSIRGRPDYYWYTGIGLKPSERIGSTGAVWGTSADNPFHGKQSLIMRATGEKDRRITLMFFEYPSPSAEEYTFSVYLRANRDGVKVRIDLRPPTQGPANPEEFWTLSNKWQRYTKTFTMPANRGCGEYFTFLLWLRGNEAARGEAAGYMDAIQLEKGPTATEFDP